MYIVCFNFYGSAFILFSSVIYQYRFSCLSVSTNELFYAINALIQHQKFHGSIIRTISYPRVVSYSPRVAGSQNCSRSYVSHNTLCRYIARICDLTERYARTQLHERTMSARLSRQICIDVVCALLRTKNSSYSSDYRVRETMMGSRHRLISMSDLYCKLIRTYN